MRGHLVVLPSHREAAAARPGAASTGAAAEAGGAEVLEQVREVHEPVEVALLEAELAAPARRRADFLARPVLAELVVGAAVLGIGEGLVGLVELLEALLGVLLLRNVGVVLLREFAVRLLDVVRRGAAGHLQGRVVVLVLHGPLNAIPRAEY